MELLLLQFVVLAFTALVWWLARRDLSLRASQLRAGESEQLERLRAGVEDLAADLERRAEAVEARLVGRMAEARALSVRPVAEERQPIPGQELCAAEDRYAPALAMAASGITDPTEIARRTGLGRGEVELLLSLRARRAP